MKTLRLLLFDQCNRACPGCVNHDWDIPALPVCESFEGYDEIILTGGEPMLKPGLVKGVAQKCMRENPSATVIMYTAKADEPEEFLCTLSYLDGVTLTLHEQKDVLDFVKLQSRCLFRDKSLRLNVFAGVDLGGIDTWPWKVKDDIEWLKDCPLPENEVFMRLS